MTQNITINKTFTTFAEWLADTLLPASDVPETLSTKSVVRAMRGWNAAEVADAISSVVTKTIFDENGNPDMEAAQRFTSAEVIQRAIGLRRGSRLDTIRNKEKVGLAFAALYETISIAAEILDERDVWQAGTEQFDAVADENALVQVQVHQFDALSREEVEMNVEADRFDVTAYEEEQAQDDFFVTMLNDDELLFGEIQDAIYEMSLSRRTLRRDRLRMIDIEINKMNIRERGAGKRNSGRNRNEVSWSKFLNAIRRPSQRKEATA